MNLINSKCKILGRKLSIIFYRFYIFEHWLIQYWKIFLHVSYLIRFTMDGRMENMKLICLKKSFLTFGLWYSINWPESLRPPTSWKHKQCSQKVIIIVLIQSWFMIFRIFALFLLLKMSVNPILLEWVPFWQLPAIFSLFVILGKGKNKKRHVVFWAF